MEVLTTTRGPFHDPTVKWVSHVADNLLVLLIGSEVDRIRITFTAEELGALLSPWADHLHHNREWQTPEGP